jgi:radical SAM/Cys-rich protein
MTNFDAKVLEAQSEPLRAENIKILQVNLGYMCNMSCKHCHIEAGPNRTERMERQTVDHVLDVLRKHDAIETLDITGGAPELNSFFRYLVQQARDLHRHVIVRTNLTIFFEEGFGDIPQFFSDNRVEVIASLPHYMEESVDRVRGKNTFQKSIDALKVLNKYGYGQERRGKLVHLVYNPIGAFLPSTQRELEDQYRNKLKKEYGIIFNNLYTFANMPLGRFRDFLERKNGLEKYMLSVENAFNPSTLNGLMCRYLVSVGWDGSLYDCDFNQILGLTVDLLCPDQIADFHYEALAKRRIVTADHCFVCTAGQGST